MSAEADYLDITGKIDVLEGAHSFDADAKSAGVALCLGLKNALPEANELALGIESSDRRMSAGTAKTLVEGLARAGKFAATAESGSSAGARIAQHQFRHCHIGQQ